MACKVAHAHFNKQKFIDLKSIYVEFLILRDAWVIAIMNYNSIVAIELFLMLKNCLIH